MALERFFAWLDRVLAVRSPAGVVSAPGSRSPAPEPARAAPARALLSVDGGGQYLLCAADRLTLGHVRAARADLCFLADVGALHAELVRVDSLRDGPGWRLVPCGSEACALDGRAVSAGGERIGPGACVRLGLNLEFRLRQPDPASASVALELLHGAQCDGARSLLLLAPGPGGRVRIGAQLAHHVKVPGLELALELEWHGPELRVHADPPLEEAAGVLPFPPRERVELTCGRPRGSRPPFALALEPVLLGR